MSNIFLSKAISVSCALMFFAFTACAAAFSAESPTVTSCAVTTDGAIALAGNKTIDYLFEGAWLQKVDASGKQVWEKLAAAEQEDLIPADIKATGDGGYIMAANTSGHYAAVIKFNSSGDVVWMRKVEHPWRRVLLKTIFAIPGGGYFAAGTVLVRLDAKGTILWKKDFNGVANAIDSAGGGNIIVAGQTPGDNDSRPGTMNAGWDIFVEKINSKGEPAWRKTFGGKFDDYATSLSVLSDGNIAVAGVTSYGDDSDVLVMKLTKDGYMAWEKVFGGRGKDEPAGIEKGEKGAFLVAGRIGFETPDAGDDDARLLLLKLNAAGEISWRLDFGKDLQSNAPACLHEYRGGYVIAENRAEDGKTAPVVLRVNKDGGIIQSSAYSKGGQNPFGIESANLKDIRFASPSGFRMDRIVHASDCGDKDGREVCATNMRLSLVGYSNFLNTGHRQAILEGRSCGAKGNCSSPIYYVADLLAFELYVLVNTDQAMNIMDAAGNKLSGELQGCVLATNALRCGAALFDASGNRSERMISISGNGPVLKAKIIPGDPPKALTGHGTGLAGAAVDFCGRLVKDPESVADLVSAEFTYYAASAGEPGGKAAAPDDAALAELKGSIGAETGRVRADSCSIVMLDKMSCDKLLDSMMNDSIHDARRNAPHGIGDAFSSMKPALCGSFLARTGRKSGEEHLLEIDSVYNRGKWEIIYPFSER